LDFIFDVLSVLNDLIDELPNDGRHLGCALDISIGRATVLSVIVGQAGRKNPEKNVGRLFRWS
jgi:hypothetical protein